MVEIILGYAIYTNKLDNLVLEINKLISNKKDCYPLQIAFFNAHSYYVSKYDYVFKNSLLKSNFLLPDGISIIIASIILGGNIRKRICGPDFFLSLNNFVNKFNKINVFFLGSTNHELSVLVLKFKSDFPNINICGFYSPPFCDSLPDDESRKIINNINNLGIDILWVSMTAPKQEKWVYQNSVYLNVKVVCSVGAAFDYYTGKLKRPSKFLLNFGFEWFFRLIQQPKKISKRVFISFPVFLFDVFCLSLKTYILYFFSLILILIFIFILFSFDVQILEILETIY